MLRLLEYKSTLVCGAAAFSLGQLGVKEAALRIVPLSESSDPYLRVHALAALVCLGQAERVRDLMVGLKAKDPVIRIFTARVLGEMRCGEAVAELEKLLKVGQTRPAAREALKRIALAP